MADKDLRPKPSPGIGKLKQTERKKIVKNKKKQKAISVEEFKTKAPKLKQEPQYPRNKKQRAYDIFEKNLDKIEEFAPERIKTMTQKAKPHSSAEGRLSVLKREIDPLYDDAKKRAEMSPAPGAYKNGGSVRLARKGGGRAYGKNS